MPSKSKATKKTSGGQLGNQNARKWTKLDALIVGRKLYDWTRAKADKGARIFIDEFFYRENEYPIGIDDMLKDADHLPVDHEVGLKKYGIEKKDLAKFLKKHGVTEHDSFTDLYKRALKNQELKLRMGGLGKANTTMAIFCLKNNHGYADRVDHTTKGNEMQNTIKIEHVDYSNDPRMKEE